MVEKRGRGEGAGDVGCALNASNDHHGYGRRYRKRRALGDSYRFVWRFISSDNVVGTLYDARLHKLTIFLLAI